MINVDKFSVGMLFIGAGLGGLVAKFITLPINLGSEVLSIVFIVIGVLFLIWR